MSFVKYLLLFFCLISHRTDHVEVMAVEVQHDLALLTVWYPAANFSPQARHLTAVIQGPPALPVNDILPVERPPCVAAIHLVVDIRALSEESRHPPWLVRIKEVQDCMVSVHQARYHQDL